MRFSTNAGPKQARNLTPPSISRSDISGSVLTVSSGTWSIQTEKVYSIYASGSLVPYFDKVYFNDVASFTCNQPGPVIVRESALLGGSYVDSSNSIEYSFSQGESAVMLPDTAIWLSQFGVTTEDADTTVDRWASSFGGLSCTLVAPASNNRPAFFLTGGVGGRPLIVSDGVDDGMGGQMYKGSTWTTFEFGVVGSRVAYGTASDCWWGYGVASTNLNNWINDESAAAGRFSIAAGANVSFGQDPDGNIQHWSGDAETGEINSRVGGTIANSSAGTVTARADGGYTSFGSRADAGGNWGNFAAQAGHMGPKLTAIQRDYLRQLLSFYTGVVC